MNSVKDEAESRHWHLDKRVNVSHIIATVLLAISAIGAWSAQNERITRVEAAVEAQNIASIKEAAGIRDALNDLKGELRQVRQLLIEQIKQQRYQNDQSTPRL